MKTSEVKIASSTIQRQKEQSQQPFFKKQGDDHVSSNLSTPIANTPFFTPTNTRTLIQKQEGEVSQEPESSTGFLPKNPGWLRGGLKQPFMPKIDWLDMNKVYIDRGLVSMPFRDYDVIKNRWLRTYGLAINFGLSPKKAEFAANKLTPLYVNAGLQHDNPTLWEQMDKKLNTSTISVSPTVLTFDLSNFSATVDSPLRTLFGGKARNPYRRNQKRSLLPKTIQPKLTIGQPNDKYEIEADQMADKVVQRLSENNTENPISKTQNSQVTQQTSNIVQHKCADCEEKERLQKKEEDGLLSMKEMTLQRKPIFESDNDEMSSSNLGLQRKCTSCGKEEDLIQEKSDTGTPNTASSSLQSRLNSAKGGGVALPETTRNSVESAFDQDFSNVRIHTDSAAVQMNKELGAQAFTHGSDIYFNSGKYETNSPSGKHLLAHELTHTVQQGGNVNGKIQKKCDKKTIGDIVSDNVGTIKERYKDPYTKKEKEERNDAAASMDSDKKRELKSLITECATSQKDIIIKAQKESKTKGKEKTFQRKVIGLCDEGINNIRRYRRKNKNQAKVRQEELALREQDLLNVKEGMSSPILVFIQFHRLGRKYFKTIRTLGNPNEKFKKTQLVEKSIFLGRILKHGGNDALVIRLEEDIIYADLGISRSSLKLVNTTTPNNPNTSPPRNSTSIGDLDEEEIQEISDFLKELEKKEEGTGESGDLKKLAEMLKSMSAKEKADFIDLYNSIEISEDGDADKELEEKLENFKKLTELERAIIKANIEKLKEHPEKDKEALSNEGKVRLMTTNEKAKENAAGFKKLNGNLEDIWKAAQNSSDPDAKAFRPLDEKGFFSLQNELAILNGLLEGAKEKSPEVKSAASSLRKEIALVQDSILKEILKILAMIAAEAAAGAIIGFFTGGAGYAYMAYKVAMLVRKLNKVRGWIEDIKRLIGIFDSIKEMVGSISDIDSKYSSFKKEFDTKLAEYRNLKNQLDSINSQEELDDRAADLQEELFELIQEKLDGELGTILENFYLPPNATEQDLMEVMLDIPDGISALQDVFDIYKQGEGSKNPEQFPGLLYVQSTTAGRKLYPFVGFLSGKAGEAIGNFNRKAKFTTEDLEAGLERIVTGTRPHRRKKKSERRKENRGKFSLFRFKKYDYEEGGYESPKTIKWALKEGFTWLKKEYSQKQKDLSIDGFWTRAWFRFTARKKLKELNINRRKWKVWAKIKGKKNKSTPKQLVPIPKFKLKWLSKRPPFAFTLKLNPDYKKDKIIGQTLTYNSFVGTGIKYRTGDKKRTIALEKWLIGRGYDITRDVKSKNFIRHMSRGKGPGRGGKQFLQIGGGMIKQDKNLALTKENIPLFIGRAVQSDLDLPEGFIIITSKKGESIRKRPGLKMTLRKHKLGIDENGVLVAEERNFPIRRTKLRILDREFQDIINPEGMVDNMFRKDGVTPRSKYKTFGKSSNWWRRHIRKKGKLKKRPKYIHATLGNTKYARALGDALSYRYLPEQTVNDDKGHIIAKRFDGNDSYNNLIPMDSKLNQLNRKGTWYHKEKGFARDFRRGRKNVEVKITLYYNNFRTRRPYRFSVKYHILSFNSSTKGWDPGPEIRSREKMIQ